MDELFMNDSDYVKTLESIKREISVSRARSVMAVNGEIICMYWKIGKQIDAKAEWGSRFIESLASDIRLAFPGIKGFSVRNLRYMLKFAREYDFEYVQTVSAQMSWSHNILLMGNWCLSLFSHGAALRFV